MHGPEISWTFIETCHIELWFDSLADRQNP